VAAGKERVLGAFRDAGVGDVGPLIQRELVITPPEWGARYGLRHGAAFGLAHGLDQLSVFRPANKDAQVPGLYFVGASTRPGNGVPLCFISAKLTAERVLKDLGQRSAESAARG
jgi:phytoene desaturase (3,4-didehydrolycopene-forming)